MLRTIMIAAVVYAYGHPCFEGYRPKSLDRGLQAFHFEVTQLVRGGSRAVDEAISRQDLQVYADKAEIQIRNAF
jgi:hypothetical protein